jgi:hypothetical protein
MKECPKIGFSLAENEVVNAPDIMGEMYISYGEQIYIESNITADGGIGYAGPDLNNPSDQNIDALFYFFIFHPQPPTLQLI